VRRARVSDVPRVLRFVRENVRLTFPTLGTPPGSANIVLGDYVARALAQGTFWTVVFLDMIISQ
jgi:hypothetical protein